MNNTTHRYRVWDTRRKKWATITIDHWNNTEQHVCIVNSQPQLFEIYSDERLGFIWELSTTMKDKKNKEIFDGDLVKVQGLIFTEPVILEVKMFHPNYPGCIMLVSEDNHCSIMDVFDDIEIVGNIHENPEMMK